MRILRSGVWFAVVLMGMAAACSGETDQDAVHILTADGTVGPIMERYLDRGIGRAEGNNAKLVVIRLDTPGGLDSSMRDIVKRIERADVPVMVYVWPPGGRAASAGTFITMAGHVAAMAPSTSIGAASAINADGSDIEGTLGKKVENDAVAFIRGIADLRGRNADWAEQAVREAVAVDANEAVELNVVDYVANDLDDALAKAEGMRVELKPGTTVALAGLEAAPRVETDMTVWERFLGWLADPTLASLLITIGFLGIIFELANPGLLFPGTIGAVCLILGFVGFGVMPVDVAGLALMAIGLALVVAELFVPGGILGAVGVLAILLGALIAFRDTPSEFRPPWWMVALMVFIFVGMFATIARGLARLRHLGAVTGADALMGQLAVVRTPLTPEGFVFVQGERWAATLEAGSAHEGERVRIVGADGLHLRVTKESEQ